MPMAIVALVGLLLLAPAAGAIEAESPDGFIDKLGEATVETLADDSLGKQEKLDELKSLLDEATNLNLVAKLVLGRYWRSASEQERQEYVDAFRQIVTKMMAERLQDYGGQTIEITGSEEVNERDTVVHTRIVTPGGGPTYQVDYRVRESNGAFAIVDVVAEGVSMVVTHRSEVSDIVARQGMDGLIQTMRQRVERDQQTG